MDEETVLAGGKCGEGVKRARLGRGPREAWVCPGRLPDPGLVEVVVRDGLGVGGVELGGLVEVVGEGFSSGRFGFEAGEIEFYLRRSPGPPGGMNQGR